MKTLLLLRHGNAQQSAPQGDKARRLTEQGRQEAAEMGRRLPEIAGSLDAVVSSDAERTLETAQIVASGAGYGGDIRVEHDLYATGVDTMLGVVRALSDEHNCVLLVGHHPSLEYLAADIAEQGTPAQSLPTCGLLHLALDATRWHDIRPATGRLLGVYGPDDGR
ncbi:MAG: histidine phosphatase family protein [Chloroflexota bacterium]|nr:histidine phosphatase family protein [Chloroflexota bacterium]MDQ5864747.1 histidine phosphatase family protein [Chloroflexota bacterium]